jgi:hypothetical protein
MPAFARTARAARDERLRRLGDVESRSIVPRSVWLVRRPTRCVVTHHQLASRSVEFSRELRNDVLAGDITLSVRLWKRPQVKEGGRYRVGPGEIEIDAIELVPFAAIAWEDVLRAGEPDRETLRRRAAHAGPIDEDTLVYRIEFHVV